MKSTNSNTKFTFSSDCLIVLSSFVILSSCTVKSQEVPTPRRFSSLISMTHNQINTAYSLDDFKTRMGKYGCHCFQENKRNPGGSGPAVDDIDSACKKLSDCHKCVNIQHGKNFQGNDNLSDREHYHWSLDNGALDCSKNEGSRLSMCLCDKKFAEEMKLVWNDNNFNEFYWKNNKHTKNNPTFDEITTCKVNNNHGALNRADACCGSSFPEMKPYSTNKRDCCVKNDGTASVFSQVTHQCCSDGEVRVMGAC